MSDSTLDEGLHAAACLDVRLWSVGASRGPAAGTVTSRRPRSRRYFNQYRRSLRPSEARFSPVRGLLGSRPLTTTASHQLAAGHHGGVESLIRAGSAARGS